MNVLYIATYEGMSGASYSLIGMINELRKRGVVPYVIVLKPGKIVEVLQQENIPYRIVRGYPWVIANNKYKSIKQRLFWLIKQLYNKRAEKIIEKIIEERDIDIVHINAFTAGIGVIAAKRKRIPCVWHIREFVEEDLGKRFWNKQKALNRLEKADCVIAISNSVKNKFELQALNAKICVIYNGIPVDEYITERNERIFSKSEVTIVIAGRVDPGKGHKEIIKALGKVVQDGNKSVKLLVAGKSQSEEYMQEIKDLVEEYKVNSYVEFLGYRSDLPNIFKKADIAIVASKAEAFGRVTVEAMMGGCLVIGADTAGTKELIGDKYGLLYKQGDDLELAEKIEQSLEDYKRMRTVAEEARKYALKKFTASNNAEVVLEVYNQLTYK